MRKIGVRVTQVRYQATAGTALEWERQCGQANVERVFPGVVVAKAAGSKVRLFGNHLWNSLALPLPLPLTSYRLKVAALKPPRREGEGLDRDGATGLQCQFTDDNEGVRAGNSSPSP